MSSDTALILPIPAACTEESLSVRFGGAAALVHCLRAVGEPSGRVIVAATESLADDVAALLATAGVEATLESVSGEPSFADCLAAGLARVTDRYVLVHDVRRALAPEGLAQRVLETLRQGADVVLPALVLVDSVKAVDPAGAVLETVDRTRLRAAQFPRGFLRERLAELLEKSGTGTNFDDAMWAAATVIEGEHDAFVLEFPRDAALADAVIACRLAGQR